jgi:hypothetical protein
MDVWYCASNSSIAILQRYQSKMFRSITDALWYVSDSTLHNDLGIPYVKYVIQERSSKHHDRIQVRFNLIEVLSRDLPGWTETNYKKKRNLSQESRCLSRYSNQSPPENKSRDFFNSNSGWWSPTGYIRHAGHQLAFCICPG